jgi:hypothetical protein
MASAAVVNTTAFPDLYCSLDFSIRFSVSGESCKSVPFIVSVYKIVFCLF